MRRTVIAALLALLVAAPLAACSGSGDAGVSASFSGAETTVQASGLAFNPVKVTLPSGTPLRIILDNQDTGVPHNVKVFQGDNVLGRSSNVTGPGRTEVRFGPLAAGTYQFACEVHPSMVGTLVITP